MSQNGKIYTSSSHLFQSVLAWQVQHLDAAVVLEIFPAETENIAALSVTLQGQTYSLTSEGDGEERTLLSMQSVDQTGGTLDPAGSTGAIAGDLSGRFREGWQDELWLELTVTDRAGQTFTYPLPLRVTQVTGPGAD